LVQEYRVGTGGPGANKQIGLSNPLAALVEGRAPGAIYGTGWEPKALADYVVLAENTLGSTSTCTVVHRVY